MFRSRAVIKGLGSNYLASGQHSVVWLHRLEELKIDAEILRWSDRVNIITGIRCPMVTLSSDELGDQWPSVQVSPGTKSHLRWSSLIELWVLGKESGTNAILPEYLSCFLINTDPTNNIVSIQTPWHQGPPLFQDKMLSTPFINS